MIKQTGTITYVSTATSYNIGFSTTSPNLRAAITTDSTGKHQFYLEVTKGDDTVVRFTEESSGVTSTAEGITITAAALGITEDARYSLSNAAEPKFAQDRLTPTAKNLPIC